MAANFRKIIVEIFLWIVVILFVLVFAYENIFKFDGKKTVNENLPF